MPTTESIIIARGLIIFEKPHVLGNPSTYHHPGPKKLSQKCNICFSKARYFYFNMKIWPNSQEETAFIFTTRKQLMRDKFSEIFKMRSIKEALCERTAMFVFLVLLSRDVWTHHNVITFSRYCPQASEHHVLIMSVPEQLCALVWYLNFFGYIGTCRQWRLRLEVEVVSLFLFRFHKDGLSSVDCEFALKTARY